MNKKERAIHGIESDVDSMIQSIYTSEKCHDCPYLRRLRKVLGNARIVMDYGHAPKNSTLTTFNVMIYDKRTEKERTIRRGKINHRVKGKLQQKRLD